MVFDVDGRMYVGNGLEPMVGYVPDTWVNIQLPLQRVVCGW
jgi:hypothetical protein